MSTLAIGPGASSLGNGDRKAGVQCNFSTSGTAIGYDTNIYNYSLSSVTMNISSCKYYSVYGYFDVYNQSGTLIGRTKQWNVAENAGSVKASGASTVSCTFTLINTDLAAAMQTSSFYIIIRRSSGSGNCCNIRSGCTGTLNINYTRTALDITPTVVYPVRRDATNYICTYNANPWIHIKFGGSSTTEKMQVGYTMSVADGGAAIVSDISWRDTWHTKDEIEQWRLAQTLTPGKVVINFYVRDQSTLTVRSGPTIYITFLADPFPDSSKEIDDSVIDILQEKVNNIRYRYYNMSKYDFTQCDNGTPITNAQLQELDTALEATPHIATTYYITPGQGVKATFSQLQNFNIQINRA